MEPLYFIAFLQVLLPFCLTTGTDVIMNGFKVLSYHYENRGDLLKAQRILLGLCMFLKRNLVAYMRFHLKVLFFDVIFLLLKRSELASKFGASRSA